MNAVTDITLGAITFAKMIGHEADSSADSQRAAHQQQRELLFAAMGEVRNEILAAIKVLLAEMPYINFAEVVQDSSSMGVQYHFICDGKYCCADVRPRMTGGELSLKGPNGAAEDYVYGAYGGSAENYVSDPAKAIVVFVTMRLGRGTGSSPEA